MSLKNAHFFQQHALFGGSGTVDVWNLKSGPTPPFSAVLWCQLEPNGRVGHHRQADHPEILIGVSGTGSIEVNREALPNDFCKGSLVYLPVGAVLAIENKSDRPLEYLIVKAVDPKV